MGVKIATARFNDERPIGSLIAWTIGGLAAGTLAIYFGRLADSFAAELIGIAAMFVGGACGLAAVIRLLAKN